MNKKNIGIICILIVVSGIFIGLKYLIPTHDLFSYNLMEIFTALVVTFAIYYFTKENDEVRRKNSKIENIIEVLKNKFYDVFDQPIDVDKKAKYLHTFKFIDNKIDILNKLSNHLKCENEITVIINEKQILDDFIMENIGQGNDYYLGDSVKDKIPNILCNIETHLDKIILKIYDNK